LLEDREVVAEVIKDHIVSASESTPITSAGDDTRSSTTSSSVGGDYLDTLDEETVETINGLVGRLPELGLVKTIELAQSMNPFYLDVYHDALVNKLYEELVAKGFLKK
jgi:hypothetical protein